MWETLNALLPPLTKAAITAQRDSSELIERYVWSVAPEEAAEAQKKNHQAICALEAAHADALTTLTAESESPVLVS